MAVDWARHHDSPRVAGAWWPNRVNQRNSCLVASGRWWACKTLASETHACRQNVLLKSCLRTSSALLKLNNILAEEASDHSGQGLPAEL